MSEDAIKNFHTDLRKSKGKFALFLGAGFSYDYGIPTMDEMAQILRLILRIMRGWVYQTSQQISVESIVCNGREPIDDSSQVKPAALPFFEKFTGANKAESSKPIHRFYWIGA